MASPYNDPEFIQLGDLMNARVKMRHGALSHIITARILDSYPSAASLQKLVDNPQQLDKLSDQVAKEVLPGSVNTPDDALPNPGSIGCEPLPLLTRTSSWSELLLYSRTRSAD
jgi:hypothetical protein